MKDLLTGEEFIPKRKSQKFATRANGIKYNNQKANKLREENAYIDKPINKNHKILIEMMGNERRKTFSEQFMLGKGFNFEVSNHYDMIEGIRHPFIYKFGIIINGDGTITIQKI
ncbi:hypothetical protein [Flavobacterium sp.]|uniref:hypothetical protein n=1 Tax=Flavobacterium sp. TaxID=239 RepID=UPI002B4B5639|nr:hypothetical protein [Flavobacterium sp.]HLF52294.1 hypothetical protein [Flavobacterium sp.]